MSEIVDHCGNRFQFVSKIRDNDFDLYESREQNIFVNSHYDYELNTRCRRKINVQSNKTNDGHVKFQGRNNFNVNAYKYYFGLVNY